MLSQHELGWKKSQLKYVISTWTWMKKVSIKVDIDDDDGNTNDDDDDEKRLWQWSFNDNHYNQSGVSTNQTRGAQADKTVFVATGRLATPQVTVSDKTIIFL